MTKTINIRKFMVKKLQEMNHEKPIEDARELEQSILQGMFEAFKDGKNVKFANLCIIQPVDTPARLARNPKTKEEVMIPARKRLKIKNPLTSRKRLNNEV